MCSLHGRRREDGPYHTSPADPRAVLPSLLVSRGATVSVDEAAVSLDLVRAGIKDFTFGTLFLSASAAAASERLDFSPLPPYKQFGGNLNICLSFLFLPLNCARLLARASWRVHPNSVVIVQKLAAPQQRLLGSSSSNCPTVTCWPLSRAMSCSRTEVDNEVMG